ncbi:MAG: FecR family protein [Myxococcales bacterium]|jgi:ferric-dicitrate binding protein FerR (iron transport regulator)
MSDPTKDAHDLLAPLREAPLHHEPDAALARARDRVLPGLRAQVEALPARRAATRRARNVGGAGLLAAAAALLLWIGARPAPEPGAGDRYAAGATDDGTPAPAATEAPAPPARGLELLALSGSDAEPSGGSATDAAGAQVSLDTLAGTVLSPSVRALRTGDGAARLRTPRGATVRLAADSRLELSPGDLMPDAESLRLTRGEVSCAVPPLGEAGRFAVNTPDARVVVHGTRFSVRVGDGTCVRVREGLVAVHHAGGERRLGPGQQWGCEGAAAEPATAVQDDSRSDAQSAPRAARRARVAGGTLEAQNALLRDALRAEQAGDPARSCELLGSLLDRYPDTPFAEVAHAGLERCR